MNHFQLHHPTAIQFGKDSLHQLGERIKGHAKKGLLVYGGGSMLDGAKAIAAGVPNSGDVMS